MKQLLISLTLFALAGGVTYAQEVPQKEVSELKKEILALRADVDHVQLNLGKSKKKFQSGILVATIGYTVTIAGGLMLGRENDDIGQGLLVAGGATGVIGTYMLVDSFKYLGRASEKSAAASQAY